jgi:Caspase domain
VGPLKNPHDDIALVNAALEKLGFNVTLIKDAGYKRVETALRTHIQQVRRAGKDAVSFLYYSGHGASDPNTETNYLIPVDVESADDTSLWTNSLELGDIVNKLRDQSPNATHYIVFDACREELRLTREGKKALGAEKGFVPVGNISGVMIAYATAPGKTASDSGHGGGAYAKALSEEIVKPGVEAVTMFRRVQLKVKQAIDQDPWLSFPTLPAVYFAGTKTKQQLELDFWLSVKDSTNPAVLATYLERYPDGEFAAIARALAEQYDRKLKAEQATQEEERRRIEEEGKAAEVERLELERRTREVAIAEERNRAEKDKDNEKAGSLEERQRAELVKGTEELHKALEEARRAREAAKSAEDQRVLAMKEAEEATKAANDAISVKRDREGHSDPVKVATLPKLERPSAGSPFDGIWYIHRVGSGCAPKTQNVIQMIHIANGTVSGRGVSGAVKGTASSTGQLRYSHPSHPAGSKTPDGYRITYQVTLHGNRGSGTFHHTMPGNRCYGTIAATR